MPDQTVTVRLFATLKEAIKNNQLAIDLSEPITIDELRQQIIAQYPALAELLPAALAAVNQEYVFPGHMVNPGDEIAFFPPVSGGQSFAEITLLADTPIDLNTLTAQIVTPQTGAIALFSGYVRGETRTESGKVSTAYLEYEAYEAMARAKMQQVIQEIREQWPQVQGIAIVQRTGKLEVGDPTVLIACAAAHRDHGCFEASRYGIDRLKEIVPVWKKEVGSDGESWVEGSYHPIPDDVL